MGFSDLNYLQIFKVLVSLRSQQKLEFLASSGENALVFEPLCMIGVLLHQTHQIEFFQELLFG